MNITLFKNISINIDKKNDQVKKEHPFFSNIGMDGLPLGYRPTSTKNLVRLLNDDELLLNTINGMHTGEIVEPVIEISEKEIEIKREEVKPNLISLSFNNAPGVYLEAILDILKYYNCPSTFFVYGEKIGTSNNKLHRISGELHEIAVHSYTERISFSELTAIEVNSEINYCREELDYYGLEYSNLVRPPKGHTNQTIKDNINAPIALGDIDVTNLKDYEIEKTIKAKITPGSVIMFDTDNVNTPKSLRKILPFLISEGYNFTTISDLCYKNDKNLDNGKVVAHVRVKKQFEIK